MVIYYDIYERNGEVMRYERDNLYRVSGSKLRKVIREKYSQLMGFYALAATMCQMSEHNLHLFLRRGRRSQKNHSPTVLRMLGLGNEDFDTCFIGEESSSDSPSPTGSSDRTPLVHLLHAIIYRLNGLKRNLIELRKC